MELQLSDGLLRTATTRSDKVPIFYLLRCSRLGIRSKFSVLWHKRVTNELLVIALIQSSQVAEYLFVPISSLYSECKDLAWKPNLDSIHFRRHRSKALDFFCRKLKDFIAKYAEVQEKQNAGKESFALLRQPSRCSVRRSKDERKWDPGTKHAGKHLETLVDQKRDDQEVYHYNKEGEYCRCQERSRVVEFLHIRGGDGAEQ